METFFYSLVGCPQSEHLGAAFFLFDGHWNVSKFLNLCSCKVKRKMSFVFTITLGGRWIKEASVTGLRMNIAYSYCIRCLKYLDLRKGEEHG